MALQSLDIARRSATTTRHPASADHGSGQADRRVHLHRLQGLPGGLHGMERHPRRGRQLLGVYDNPVDLTAKSWTVMRFAEVEEKGKLEWLIRKDGCMHCADPGCLKACPAPGAIIQYANGIVDFHQENCIGCGYCITGCPFNVPRISQEDSKAYKCSLCSDRVAVGQAPGLRQGLPDRRHPVRLERADEGLRRQAHGRPQVARLRQGRALRSAGVGGTHVMYVLHHADRPELYKGLPNDPGISPLVSLWKGIAKPLATVAMAAVALGSLFHYVMKGPNEVSKELEDELEKEDAK
jgi:formate dehydrogenase iron-sulfur subunit